LKRGMKGRVLLLFSGGLDSLLAARVLLEAGAETQAVHFVTPFTGSMEKRLGERYLDEWGVAVRRVRIPLDEFRPLIEHPAHGFGRALNPCIDCKILFMRKAREILKKEGLDAVASGEVVGERPMSQNRHALGVIEREAGLEGLLLRPLSAKLLPQTDVEKRGAVDRDKLLAIKGRSRKPQLELARRWGITEFATPAGGCLLTEPGYANKLKDLLEHDEATDGTVELLKTGRHFRHPEGPKLVVGRNREENERLLAFAEDKENVPGVLRVEVRGTGSPIGLLFASDAPAEVLAWAAAIVARYSDAKDKDLIEVTWWAGDGPEHTLEVVPLKDTTDWRL